MSLNKKEIVLKLKSHSDTKKAIELDNMSLDEVKAFQTLLKSFAALAALYDSNSKIKLTKSSAALHWVMDETTLRIVEDDMDEMFEDNSQKKNVVKHFRDIQSTIKWNEFEIEFDLVKSSSTTRSIASHFKRTKAFNARRGPKTKRISELEFITGELVDLGGQKINFHVKTNGIDLPVIINCSSKSEARRVRNYLYSNIYVLVHTQKTASTINRDFIDVYTNEDQYKKFKQFYEHIQSLDGADRYTYFYNLIHEELSNTKDIDKSLKIIRKYVRFFNNSWTEPGLLRTILVSLKSFKTNPILKEQMESLIYHLKRITKKEKI